MEYIEFKVQKQTGILTISRAEALNALNTGVLEELKGTVDAIREMKDIRCLVVTGSGGKSFVAGADIAEMFKMDAAAGREFSQFGSGLFMDIETLPMPVIAAVNGYALGGGCELALACDIRIASENAVFGQPETGLGLIPGFGGTQRLARIVGPAKAKELIFAGTRINAREALEAGLVNRVVPQDALTAEAMALAEKISANAPVAVRLSKQAINHGMQCDIVTAMHIETEMFAQCFYSRDSKKGMQAFLNKEKNVRFDNE